MTTKRIDDQDLERTHPPLGARRRRHRGRRHPPDRGPTVAPPPSSPATRPARRRRRSCEGMLTALEERTGPTPTWAGVHHHAVEHIVTEPGTGAATPHGTFPIATGWSPTSPTPGPPPPCPSPEPPASSRSTRPRRTRPAHRHHGGDRRPPARRETARLLHAFKLDGRHHHHHRLDAVPELVAAARGQTTRRARCGDDASRRRRRGRPPSGRGHRRRRHRRRRPRRRPAVFDTGRHLPAVLLAPPSALGGLPSATDLAAAGIRIVLAHLDRPVLVAPGAVIGWLLPLQATAVEPGVAGMGRAYAMCGAVAVDPAGAATWTPTPRSSLSSTRRASRRGRPGRRATRGSTPGGTPPSAAPAAPKRSRSPPLSVTATSSAPTRHELLRRHASDELEHDLEHDLEPGS